MRDAAADLGRRAWVRCPGCTAGTGCIECQQARCCEQHWSYMLAAHGPRVFVQCSRCWHRWWHDTRFGIGDRPPHLDNPLVVPPTRDRAA